MSSEPLPGAHFNRPPRQQPGELPQEIIELPPPPNTPDLPEQGWLIALIPVLGIGVMALFYALFSGSGRGGLFALPLMILAVITVGGTLAANRARRKEAERRRDKDTIQYLRLLARRRARLQAAQDVQLAMLRHGFPSPTQIFEIVLGQETRLWERRPEDADFAAFRLGTGRIASQIPIKIPDPDVQHPLLDRVLEVADSYRFLNDAAIAVSLREQVSLAVYGDRTAALGSMRAIIGQIAALHAPNDLQIYLVAPAAQYEDWRWMTWLPHCISSARGSAANLLVFGTQQARNLMGQLSQIMDERRKQPEVQHHPHLLLIVDGVGLVESETVFSAILREGRQLGASTLCFASSYETIPGACHAVLQVTSQGVGRYHHTDSGDVINIELDYLSEQDAAQIARALAAVPVQDTEAGGRIPRSVEFLDLYGVRKVENLYKTIAVNWSRPLPNGVLPHPVRIGRESLAADTELWLDEAHHGPHGVLAGTTGSGKSELLQTLICALILEHDPRLLNLLLIDFKGGSTFNVFARLPHTVGVVTNLDRTRVERTLIALRAAVETRQQFLDRLNLRDVTQYHRHYTRSAAQLDHPDYQPMPHLFIIVDEFAQLAREMPDFMGELVRIAQIGRSLGLHLILGTQSPMDVITDEMNDNLQFRICLRVQNVEASRAMLRRPDAAYLPTGWPGRGYFQVGERGLFKEFQTAYVGDDYRRAPTRADETMTLEVIKDGEAISLLGYAQPAAERFSPDDSYTIAKAISDLITTFAAENNIPHMPPLLLPPLAERLTLDSLFNAEIGGWDGHNWQPAGRDTTGEIVRVGSAPIGLMDDVQNSRQETLWLHLNSGHWERADRKDGHVLIVGGPSSGKTTALRTLALSLALLHHPDRLHLYFLSFTGGGLNDCGELPHAEQVIHGVETERVRRLFRRLIRLLDERQSGHSSTGQPLVVLFIDQFEQFRDSFYEQHMADFERLIHEGRAAGVFVVFTASSVSAVPERLRSLIQQRIALQLGSASDYALAVGYSTRGETLLPPGRGYIASSPPLLCQIALPARGAEIESAADALGVMRAIIQELQRGYLHARGIDAQTATPEDSQSPAPIKELPPQIALNTLPLGEMPPNGQIVTTLGRYDDDALNTFALDWWESGPHFLVTGPPGSGKTNLLQAAALAACASYSPQELRLLLVDFGGRGLRPLRGLKHVLAYISDATEFETQLTLLRTELLHLHTGEEDVAEKTAPKTVILIDDYDVTSETLGFDSPLLRQLRDALRLYSEAGLHLWIAGYFERASDPLLKHLLLKRCGFAFGTRENLYTLSVRAANLPADPLPRGRAYFAQYNTLHIVQTAFVENPLLYANRINAQIWGSAARAGWQHGVPASFTPSHTDDLVTPDIDTQGLIRDLLGGEAEA